jgi:hypothetical protein
MASTSSAVRGPGDRMKAALSRSGSGPSRQFGDVRSTSAFAPKADIHTKLRHVSKVPQPDSSTRQVRTFRDLFLITELLDSKAESDDVGF